MTTTNQTLSEKIARVDKLYEEANKGQSAEAILKLLDPLIDERLGKLLDEFEKCAPDLGPLLDLRAKITEIWRMRRRLSDVKKLGSSASKVIESLIAEKNINVRLPDKQ